MKQEEQTLSDLRIQAEQRMLIPLHDRLNLIARLRIIDPTQSRDAINKAITEYMCGDYASLSWRCCLPRSALRQAPVERAGYLRQMLTDMGLPE